MTPVLDILQAGDRVGVIKAFGDAWLQAYRMDMATEGTDVVGWRSRLANNE